MATTNATQTPTSTRPHVDLSDAPAPFNGPLRTVGFFFLGGLSHFWFTFLCDLQVLHHERLVRAISNADRSTESLSNDHDNEARVAAGKKRGLVTVMNHASVIDEPLMGAMVPWRFFYHHDRMRWTLAAEDFCFTNAVANLFYKTHKAIPLRRNGGLSQPAVAHARDLVCDQGEWLHMYPEGKVYQDGIIRPVKRGVARMTAASSEDKVPVVLPLYSAGIQDCVPLGTWWPRWGRTVTVVVGQPVDLVPVWKKHRGNTDAYDAAVVEQVQLALTACKKECDAIHAARIRDRNDRGGSIWDLIWGTQHFTPSSSSSPAVSPMDRMRDILAA
jgi:monolysocardiolipin acyltransferase